MRLEEKPMFKKQIVPWYETESACFFQLIAMFFVFLFGAAGISVSLETPDYYEYIWVPIVLMLLSGLAVGSTLIRLIKRYVKRLSK